MQRRLITPQKNEIPLLEKELTEKINRPLVLKTLPAIILILFMAE